MQEKFMFNRKNSGCAKMGFYFATQISKMNDYFFTRNFLKEPRRMGSVLLQ